MEQVNVTFISEGNSMIIQCKTEEKMKDICQNYSNLMGINMNLLEFLYKGKELDFELTLNEINKNDKDIKILVNKNEEVGLINQKSFENILIQKEKLDEIIKNNENIKETINGIKIMVDNVIKNSEINEMNMQLKNINILLNNVSEDLDKNSEKMKNITKDNKPKNYAKNKNMIRGLICINSSEINEEIVLFKADPDNNIDVYINNKKIDILVDDNEWKYIFSEEGNYLFEIIFNNNINNMKAFFEGCSNIINLDFSNFNSSNVTDISFLFSECHQLKEVIGLNKFNTDKVEMMNAMFYECEELEYLDLSNFNTKNVINMEGMFFNCKNLKEIKGINKFNTEKVTSMNCMFQNCNELEYLDLTNFNTANTKETSWMFNECHKLKEIKGIDKFNTDEVTDMSGMFPTL